MPIYSLEAVEPVLPVVSATVVSGAFVVAIVVVVVVSGASVVGSVDGSVGSVPSPSVNVAGSEFAFTELPYVVMIVPSPATVPELTEKLSMKSTV